MGAGHWSAATEYSIDAVKPMAFGTCSGVSSTSKSSPSSPELMALVEPVLGRGAFAVRGLYFDKTPETNWNLPWHQDLTIAVCERREVEGFGPWTLKAGIPHVHAPADLLGRMLTVRIHLDECGPGNGPMRPCSGARTRMGSSPRGKSRSWSARAGEIGQDRLGSSRRRCHYEAADPPCVRVVDRPRPSPCGSSRIRGRGTPRRPLLVPSSFEALERVGLEELLE